MSSTTTKGEDYAAQGQHGAATAHKAPEKVKLEVLVALLATDVCHGDAHYRAQIQEMAQRLLKELGGGDEVKEPNAEQLQAREAAGRLEGLPTGIRAAQDQPAMRQDEHRMAQPTKAA